MDHLTVEDLALLHKLEFDAAATNSDILTDQEKIRARAIKLYTEQSLSCLDQEITSTSLLARREVVEQRLSPSTGTMIHHISTLVDEPVIHQTLQYGPSLRLSKIEFALAPHKKLLPELLANIFVWSMAGDWLNFPTDLSLPPWVLLEVCSQWRQVALSELNLWNKVVLTHSPSMNTERFLELVSRVRPVLPAGGPLYIGLHCDNKLCADGVFDDFILPMLPRIKDLRVHTDIFAFAKLFDAPPNALTSLTSMQLHLSNISRTGVSDLPEFDSAVIFRHAANLRRIEIYSRKLAAPLLLPLPLPWHQLSSLLLKGLRYLTPTHLNKVLQECVELQELSATLSGDTDARAVVSGLHLLHLQILDLDGSLGKPHSLSRLLFPWAQLTTIRLFRFTSIATPSETYDMLSECLHLQQFSVDTPRIRVELTDLRTAGIILPHLTNLIIRLPVGNSLIMKNLVVPALTSLHVACTGTYLIPAELISDMIAQSGCSLLSLICDTSYVEYQALDRLLPLLESLEEFMGTDVLIHTSDIQRIASGEVLPRLRRLTCHLRVDALEAFIDLLETRLTQEGAEDQRISSIRYARCYINPVEDISKAATTAAQTRVEGLNAKYGSDFGVCRVG
ncbi:hypothetical protein FPV67DRAFT_1451637 [Lyophyllum atratum]|nr:hypothetical protein FPV67DRAFT_1451637 [Lyophyllum atratum]